MAESVGASREDIPLKRGKSSRKWHHCPGYSEDHSGGSKYISGAFGTLTLIITLALFVQIYYGDYQVVPHGSVASDDLECSTIGTHVLKKGGGAVDAAIATSICLCVATPHVTGLDAEGKMLIYDHKSRTRPVVIDFSHRTVNSSDLPSLVMGLAHAHKRFGRLPWSELVYPSVVLARKGAVASKMLTQAISESKLEDLFGRLEPGHIFKQENLTYTLEDIANTTESELYSYLEKINETSLTTSVVRKIEFARYNVFAPHEDVFIEEALREIGKTNYTERDVNSFDFISKTARLVESFHENGTYHEGTISNVAVMDTDDVYVSLVTGLYQFFGTGEKTSLGYFEDVKNKLTTCTRTPLLITDKRYVCGRRFVFGANNLSTALRILTALLIGNINGRDALEAPRYRVDGAGKIGFEGAHSPVFGGEMLKDFEKIGFELYAVREPYESSNIVEKFRDELSSHSDSRGGGIASRF
ncbi:unnamed protein product [Phyllotreta striolata]|uniref:Uncharacterized protein n=1 Tax=Phyllotreta striolata TaxID=444603 RepID=A0A9N9XM83_PHYSR|nr:unnamed protein product [Phyllotreta striolata]